MAIISWQRQGNIEAMRRVMDSMFEDMLTLRQRQMVDFNPAVELEDTSSALVLRAEIPGIDARDLDIRVTKQAVIISGEKSDNNQTEKIGYFRSEFIYGKFQRVIPLPVAIQNDSVQAEYKDGILSLTLPKASTKANQVVKVNLVDNAVADEEAPVVESPSAGDKDAFAEATQLVQEPQKTKLAEETEDVWTTA